VTEPTVTPAVPAEPATPAASVVPDPAAIAAAVAPAEPAAPAVVAPAAPAEPASLIDPASAAPAAPAAPASLVPTDSDPTWYLSEGVGGEGAAPDWFKSDKYNTMFDQAKAYPDLEKRFGAFTGAPDDGVYKVNVPEGVPVAFDTEHQLFQDLNKWASESQLSQKAYDDVIGMLTTYEMSVAPDMGVMKKELGENADTRLASAAQWAKSNLSTEEYADFRASQTERNAAAVFRTIEAVIAKTRQVAMPKPGDDVPGAIPTGLDEINKMQAALDDEGRRKYEHDSAYRAKVEKMRFDWFEANPQG